MDMGLGYLDYNVSMEESSLLAALGLEHPTVKDSDSIHRCGWAKVFELYLAMQDAQELAPPPRLVTAVERQRAREQEKRLLIAEQDERAMVRWKQHFLEDVAAESAFWDGQRAVRVAA
ncbi:Glycosyltransferase family 61 protein [Hordeum vulgare]|nr:Glycosyltransferase family 61 protein [Hordeum vulgare]